MKLPLALSVLLLVGPSFAATSDYTITILKREAVAGSPRPEYQPSSHLVGKSITAIFGPVSEIRVEVDGVNITGIEEDKEQVKQRIRERIDRAKCLGRDSEVPWHKAPWVRGYILFMDGRILPIEILLSGITVGNFLFTTQTEPNGAATGASPRR